MLLTRYHARLGRACALQCRLSAVQSLPSSRPRGPLGVHPVVLRRLFEPNKIRPVCVVHAHPSEIFDVAVSPSGELALSAGRDRRVRLYRLDRSGKATALTESGGHSGFITSAAFSPDGRFALTGSADYTARLWKLEPTPAEPESLALVGTLRGHRYTVSDVAFTADGRRAVTTSWDRTVRIWGLDFEPQPPPDMRNSHVRARMIHSFRDHGGWVGAGAISPDGRWLVAGSNRASTRLWGMDGRDSSAPSSVPTTIERTTHDHAKPATPVVEVGRHKTPTDLHPKPDTSPARSTPDGEGSSLPAASLQHDSAVTSAAFSPDGAWMVTGTVDGTGTLWRVHEDGPNVPHVEEAATFQHEHAILGVAFNHAGDLMVTGSLDHTARVWSVDLANPRVPRIKPSALFGHEGAVYGVAFTPDGRYVVTGAADGALRVWAAPKR